MTLVRQLTCRQCLTQSMFSIYSGCRLSLIYSRKRSSKQTSPKKSNFQNLKANSFSQQYCLKKNSLQYRFISALLRLHSSGIYTEMERLRLAQCYRKATEFLQEKWTTDLQKLKRKIVLHAVFIHFFPFQFKEEAGKKHMWIQKCLALINPCLSSVKIESSSLL